MRLALLLLVSCIGSREPAPPDAPPDATPDAPHVCSTLECDWLWCEEIEVCVCREVVGYDFVCPVY